MQKSSAFKQHSSNKLRIGFLVNPYAGIGGPAALKGSDSTEARALLDSGHVSMHAAGRAEQFLKHLEFRSNVEFISAPGIMGETFLNERNIPNTPIAIEISPYTTAKDTTRVVLGLVENNIDILVFLGGDGTARDVCAVVEENVPVLGIPSGVKMHSGVFAITPATGAKVVNKLIDGSIVSLMQRDVRDIDEAAFQKGIVKSRCYGFMRVPEELHYVQSVKQGGVEVDELVLADIAAEIEERMSSYEEALFIIGSGSTTEFIKSELGMDATLLGVDVLHNHQQLVKDADEGALLKTIADYQQSVSFEVQNIVLILSVIGGQGHLIGRGNQQLSPHILNKIEKSNIWVVATKSKLEQLQGKSFIVDSGDEALDKRWQGVLPVITGFRDEVLVRVCNDFSQVD